MSQATKHTRKEVTKVCTNYPSPYHATLYLSLFKLSPSCSLYHSVFAGKDASRALAKSSLKAEDCVPEWDDLPETEKKTLEDWTTFFSKRYNIVGTVEGAQNMG